MAAPTAVPRSDSVRTRRADLEDVDPILACYDAWASAQNGPLSRRGVSFPATAEEILGSFTRVTVAEDSDGVVRGTPPGIAWNDWGEKATIAVSDLLATTADGYRALLGAIGSFASITGTCRLDTSDFDLLRLFLPTLAWRVVRRTPYMIKILDVPMAISIRRYPLGLERGCGSGCMATSSPATTAGTRSRSPAVAPSALAMIMGMSGRSPRTVWPCCTPACSHAPISAPPGT